MPFNQGTAGARVQQTEFERVFGFVAGEEEEKIGQPATDQIVDFIIQANERDMVRFL